MRAADEFFRWNLSLESSQRALGARVETIQERVSERLSSLATQTEVLSYLNHQLQAQLKESEWKLGREQDRTAQLERERHRAEAELAQERREIQRLERELVDLRAERHRQDVAISRHEERRKRLRKSIQELPRRMNEGDDEGITRILEEAREHLKN